MIFAECIFSRSATGEVSSAYFRKLADISRGGECKFSQTHGPPTETRLEGEEEGDEEERRRKRRRNADYFDIAAATKFPM